MNFLMQVNSDAAHNAASGVRPAMVSFKPLQRVTDSNIVGELSTIRARSGDIVRNSIYWCRYYKAYDSQGYW